jgi:hypothetical protein
VVRAVRHLRQLCTAAHPRRRGPGVPGPDLLSRALARSHLRIPLGA